MGHAGTMIAFESVIERKIDQFKVVYPTTRGPVEIHKNLPGVVHRKHRTTPHPCFQGVSSATTVELPVTNVWELRLGGSIATQDGHEGRVRTTSAGLWGRVIEVQLDRRWIVDGRRWGHKTITRADDGRLVAEFRSQCSYIDPELDLVDATVVATSIIGGYFHLSHRLALANLQGR